jgi:hypothetical protein
MAAPDHITAAAAPDHITAAAAPDHITAAAAPDHITLLLLICHGWSAAGSSHVAH